MSFLVVYHLLMVLRNAVVVSDFDIGFMPSDLNGKRDEIVRPVTDDNSNRPFVLSLYPKTTNAYITSQVDNAIYFVDLSMMHANNGLQD